MKQHPCILQIIPALETGGAERTAVDIGAALTQIGWTSLVASAGGRLMPDLLATNSEHIDLPADSKNPLVIFKNAKRLEEIIKTRDVDIIHARSRAPAWSAYLAAKRCGIPFVTTYHGAYNQKSYFKGLYNSVMARGNVVIANSGWTADLIASRNPWAKERITVIHRGTDFQQFKSSSVSPERLMRLRDEWNIPTGSSVVVQLARLTGWKGQSVVIDAAAEIMKDHPNLYFVLAGDSQGRDDYVAGLNAQIASHGLQDKILLPGHCDDPAAAMALSDVVVVASIEAEAFGRAAIEAGALNKPVIVSRIGAVVETVRAAPDVPNEDVTGWKVPVGDSKALASALHEALSLPPDERAKIGNRARQFGIENFSLEQMCNKTLDVYRNLLGK